jgi:hypothetical protein
MIFRVYDHYDDNQPNTTSLSMPNECFICYDIRNGLESYPISLKSQSNYIKTCRCDGWIHKQCLDIWCKKQNKCPICRLKLSEKTNVVCAIASSIPYSNRVYLSASKSVYKMTRFFLYCFLAFSIIEFYLCVARTKHLDGNNHRNQECLPYSEGDFNATELI